MYVCHNVRIIISPRHAKTDLRTVLTHRQKTRENVRERRQIVSIAGCNYQSVKVYVYPFISCIIDYKLTTDSSHIIFYLHTVRKYKKIITGSVKLLNNVYLIDHSLLNMPTMSVTSRLLVPVHHCLHKTFSQKRPINSGLRTISWIFLCKNDFHFQSFID